MKKKKIFRIQFSSQGKVIEIYARRVDSSEIHGFVAIEEILFGERTTLVVDPTEEQLKLEFNGVSKTHIPFHAVIRIDEVEREGTAKILHLASQADGAAAVPQPLFQPGKGPGKV
jgi:hypothetical protein